MPDHATQTTIRTSSSNITDQQYLEMAEHCKDIVDKAADEKKKLENENLELKKVITTAYSFIRVIDSQYDLEMPVEASYSMELIRGYLSEFIEKNIF